MKPAMGINIKDLKPGLFLLQFYHKDDMQWVLSNGPWTFDGALLVTNVIKVGEDPTRVSLFEVDFWIQIHDLPVGYMSEVMGKQLGNFFGSFLQYDSKNNSSIWREFMRLRVRVDVRKPLKRRKKIYKKDKTEVMVTCKYEKLGDFCFVCGLLSYTERFCQRKLEADTEEVNREWGPWLRSQPRRVVGGSRSKWLREDGDGDWGRQVGTGSSKAGSQGVQNPNFVHYGMSSRGARDQTTIFADNQGKFNLRDINQSHKEGNSNVVGLDGLDLEEQNGLIFEERKRRRSEFQVNAAQLNKYTTSMDSTLSGTDCLETSLILLAKLTKQASQTP